MTKLKIFFASTVLALMALSVLGCAVDPSWGDNYIVIKKIAVEYNGQKGVVELSKGAKDRLAGEGVVENGELTVVFDKLYGDGGYYGNTGSGIPYYVMVEFKNNKFAYTGGKTFQELEIDVCNSPDNFSDKLPSITIVNAEYDKHNKTTVVEFDKFQEWNTDNCTGD